MLIPLASTIAEIIYFLGFDGRTDKDKRFWSYSQDVNFNELLYFQELAHPGFFIDRDYKKYAEIQADFTERLFNFGEKMGKRYICLNKSNNSAMSQRYILDYGIQNHGNNE